MPKYSWIQKVGKSLVPGDFYLHILKEKFGSAVLYMLLFTGLLSLLVGGYLGFSSKAAIDATIDDYEKGLIPAISIKDSQLHVEGNQPIILDRFDFYTVIDDDGVYDVNRILNYDRYVLVGKDDIRIAQQGVPPLIWNFSEMMLTDISTEDLILNIQIVAIMMIPSYIVVLFFLNVFTFLFNSIFLMLLGNILRTTAGLNIKLKQVYHMVIYTMTFSVFWSHFKLLLPSAVPVWLDNFVYFAIPAMILVSVFMMIRKKALEEFNNNKGQ